ncbi:transglutaminase [Primorskyibacter flagellatus]|uniref:Transglutaminase n=1 Tax=Primorskyibacter flagellatus TaxID=1387277 RepID=A0A916ZXR9_9RHOB|nr:transglutaminase family protein [Primorskyibacter flagellatus]GGE18309.1 transglutaminase [Primorskyibacter flagellatus]
MRYDVTLKIDYEYSQPTDNTRNLLRLLPGDIPGVQTIHDWTLALTPQPSEQAHFTDFFGNWVTSAVWHMPIEEVKIALNFQAERFPQSSLLSFATPLERMAQALAAQRGAHPGSPLHFTAPTRRAPLHAEMSAFARDQLRDGFSALDAVQAVGSALHAEMTYSAEATDVDTEAAEAFAARAGVCQDYSHIMIACLRGIGIPAGYVSGFLRTYPPPGKERLVGVDAMHAWVRAWVGPETGWIEFDPTNNQFAGADYITIGYGRDYDDIAPVRGTTRGWGSQKSEQSVDVAVVG